MMVVKITFRIHSGTKIDKLRLQNYFGLIVESILGRDWEVARAIFESLDPRGQS